MSTYQEIPLPDPAAVIEDFRRQPDTTVLRNSAGEITSIITTKPSTVNHRQVRCVRCGVNFWLDEIHRCQPTNQL